MKHVTLLLFCISLGIVQVFSQNLKGKVVDQNNLPIEDVYLYHVGKKLHSHSSEKGIFELSGTFPGDSVVFTHIGYETQLFVLEAEDFEKELRVKMVTRILNLEQVVISNKLKVLNVVSDIDLVTNPVNSSQEVLQQVPGLFIGQHAGGGKAEQIFLRGFDIDHGTDVSITVDGMPVNMVSHAHGQGYADLHFLIPETIEKIDFGKGPYYSDKGNFATAGYVDFKTKDKLENSQFGLEYGQFNTLRMVGLYDLTGNSENHQAYVAAEYLASDGYFDSPQNFNRINLMGKYTGTISDDQRLSVTASHFTSKWNASGQIPQRAVDAGLITRFGAIDDTEGGNTSRTNVALSHTKYVNDNFFVKSRAFYSKYDFELYSNFTFFLNDPVNGDQIKQKESRDIFGMESSIHEKLDLGFAETNLQAGIGFRYDQVDDVELSRTANRKTTLDRLALGDVNEANFYGFLHAEFDFGKWLINPALRMDYFRFAYEDQLDSAFQSQSENAMRLSPKLNIMYSPNANLQLYAKSGMGFHSNDTRVVVARSAEEILPAAYGSDLGMIWKPIPKLMVNSALWALFLDQEFVYVGDEGVVEPSGRSRRLGIDFGLRYEVVKGLFLNGDVNYAYARSIDEPEGKDYIPLAPDLTATAGIFYRHGSGFEGGIKGRYLKTRPANEDNSISAEGYFITDLNLSYVWRGIHVGVVIENLFDTEWNETQFATETRLRNESESVEEIHFTPGRPFFAKGQIGFSF